MRETQTFAIDEGLRRRTVNDFSREVAPAGTARTRSGPLVATHVLERNALPSCDDDRWPAARQPSSSFFRRCTTSRIGGAPNSRLYSRLNCDALS